MLTHLLLALVLGATTSGDELHLSIQTDQLAIEQGVPFQLELSYSNAGKDAFYLERPTTFGPSGLDVNVRNEHCSYNITPSSDELAKSTRRLLYTPLFPGDRLTVKLPPFNDLAGMQTLDLPGPGTFEIQAIFHSQGESQEGLIWPIWRGEASSPWLSIRVVPPTSARLHDFRQRLRACLDSEPCDDYRAIEYFRLVKDSRATPLLLEIFRRDFASNPRIVEALANQDLPGSAAVIEQVAHTSSLDSSIKNYFESVAQRIRSGTVHPCDQSSPEPTGTPRPDPETDRGAGLSPSSSILASNPSAPTTRPR